LGEEGEANPQNSQHSGPVIALTHIFQPGTSPAFSHAQASS